MKQQKVKVKMKVILTCISLSVSQTTQFQEKKKEKKNITLICLQLSERSILPIKDIILFSNRRLGFISVVF